MYVDRISRFNCPSPFSYSSIIILFQWRFGERAHGRGPRRTKAVAITSERKSAICIQTIQICNERSPFHRQVMSNSIWRKQHKIHTHSNASNPYCIIHVICNSFKMRKGVTQCLELFSDWPTKNSWNRVTNGRAVFLGVTFELLFYSVQLTHDFSVEFIHYPFWN